MNSWTPNLYKTDPRATGSSEQVLDESLKQAQLVQDKGLPPVLSLGHLAWHTDVPYKYLHSVVSRTADDTYRTFPIRKRSGGYRYINVPEPRLLVVQKWIDKFILSNVKASLYSYAFEKESSIIKCAQRHLKCRWLIKIDMRHFFESLSEMHTYRVFKSLGYNNLVSFEMARICTKVSVKSQKYNQKRWQNSKIFNKPNLPYNTTNNYDDWFYFSGKRCNDFRIGHLPQGAPTSPRLANLIVRKLDNEIDQILPVDITYTRYADDMVFSTYREDFNRTKATKLIREIYRILPRHGLSPNPQKTHIVSPGARKIVLGLLVNGQKVRLSKKYRQNLECHLYHSVRSPSEHAKRRNFDTVLGLKNHVMGLLSFAKQVDEKYYSKLVTKTGIPNWPL